MKSVKTYSISTSMLGIFLSLALSFALLAWLQVAFFHTKLAPYFVLLCVWCIYESGNLWGSKHNNEGCTWDEEGIFIHCDNKKHKIYWYEIEKIEVTGLGYINILHCYIHEKYRIEVHNRFAEEKMLRISYDYDITGMDKFEEFKQNLIRDFEGYKG